MVLNNILHGGILKMSKEQTIQGKESFFTKDRSFYKVLFPMMIMIALQNLVAYSVNMADNIMLGSYDQSALSGAATVNQIFFIVQQLASSAGEGIVVLGSQYWGQKKPGPIRKLAGTALKFGLICGIIIIVLCSVIPRPILMIFTSDEAILSQGLSYIAILKYSFLLFLLSQISMAALRCVGTVNISFYISIVSLLVNVGINYTLIFGHFGAPEMGIVGAAIGTLIARIIELLIILVYIVKVDKKLCLFSENPFKKDPQLSADYRKVEIPIFLMQMIWAISVPMQTAILGHLSSDAIAANSVASTFYQYLKVIVQAMSSASAVMIGTAIGRGDMKRLRSDARTLSVLDLVIGIVLGFLLFILRWPLLSLYSMTPAATDLASQLIIVFSFVMVGMSYQMPVSMGVIRGGGDTKFTLAMNTISTWCIVMPLSFLSAFLWKWPVWAVVLCVQSDQIFKGLPTFIRFRSYKWIKKLTRSDAE